MEVMHWFQLPDSGNMRTILDRCNWRGIPADLYSELLRNTILNRCTTTMTVRAKDVRQERVKGTLLQYFISHKLQKDATVEPVIPMPKRKRECIMAVRTLLRSQRRVPSTTGDRKRRSCEALRKFIFTGY